MPKNTETLVSVRGLVVDKERLLVLKRSLNNSFGGGLWELPGGKPDSNSPSPELGHDLVRQIAEETGLVVTAGTVYGIFKSKLEESDNRYPGYLFIQIVYFCNLQDLSPVEPIVKLSEDNDGYRWVSSGAELCQLEFVPSQRNIIEHLVRHFEVNFG